MRFTQKKFFFAIFPPDKRRAYTAAGVRNCLARFLLLSLFCMRGCMRGCMAAWRPEQIFTTGNRDSFIPLAQTPAPPLPFSSIQLPPLLPHFPPSCSLQPSHIFLHPALLHHNLFRSIQLLPPPLTHTFSYIHAAPLLHSNIFLNPTSFLSPFYLFPYLNPTPPPHSYFFHAPSPSFCSFSSLPSQLLPMLPFPNTVFPSPSILFVSHVLFSSVLLGCYYPSLPSSSCFPCSPPPPPPPFCS